MQVNPYYEPRPRPPPLRFSATELRHLGVAVAALTAAFAVVIGATGSGAPQDIPREVTEALTNVPLLVAALGTTLGGFVLHELAHKVVAQRYGHWAEFRAQFPFLGITVLLAFLLKILVAAPGAVVISGRVTPKENGVISLAGPAANIVIAAITFPFGRAVDVEAALPRIMSTVAFINAILALFNLIPLGPLDGRKVLRWNKVVYALALSVAAALTIASIVVLDPLSRWE